jgi:fructan beta-fructosidase
LIAALLGFLPWHASAAALIIAGFENGFGEWRATGRAFGRGPARDGQLTRLEIENARGRGVASSELEGDGPQGTLTSPPFMIERGYISFLIAGDITSGTRA